MTTIPSRPSPSIGISRINSRPPTALDMAEPAALIPAPSGLSIGSILLRAFIVVLAIAGGTVVALVLGVLFGFIPLGFC